MPLAYLKRRVFDYNKVTEGRLTYWLDTSANVIKVAIARLGTDGTVDGIDAMMRCGTHIRELLNTLTCPDRIDARTLDHCPVKELVGGLDAVRELVLDIKRGVKVNDARVKAVYGQLSTALAAYQKSRGLL